MSHLDERRAREVNEMTFETILYDVTNEVATVTLNRPSKLNAYTPKMGNELMDALSLADEDPGGAGGHIDGRRSSFLCRGRYRKLC